VIRPQRHYLFARVFIPFSIQGGPEKVRLSRSIELFNISGVTTTSEAP